ncbi:alpha-amylase [Hujiaoplasma nucleasis]|uniref:Alpha-amylase n=1 Tax=Hujiaoplasma nucleasis TaxID=2725268 RepID=A0A7L6N445_9MOLU|nr:alpha-amylase family glycosyl hydrolase [Hujiaoplasma nucleasis]QLY40017.1 alpha-amylase [Hujiaoplasma nucleasis]
MKLNLEKLYDILNKKTEQGHINYVVPDLWNAWDYQGDEIRRLPSQEFLVNPYKFYSRLIKDIYLEFADKRRNYLKSLSSIHKDHKNHHWLLESVVYSSHIRTSASWDHDRSFSLDISNFDGLKETGTFIKMLAYLPTLKRMGINSIYLLPITKYSTQHKKGELGSPYAVRSFFDLDENLKDPMTDDQMTIDDEFKAFVEACHILDMRVIIDVIPRTNAVNSDFIREHPEWFYWIKADELTNYHSPHVETIGETIAPKEEYLKDVFESKNVKKHLAMFQKNPKEQDPELYNIIKDKENYLDLIKEKFNLVVAPAFSDWINDPQPPWSDVTFFRFYFDHPAVSQKYIDKDQAPYILYDSIKTNLYPGKKPNKELFDMIKNIIPYFQTNYGIDGARIDMGHALPNELLKMIMAEARAIDPDFGFIAEELDPSHFEQANEKGYNAVVGNGFWMEARYEEQKLKEYIFSSHKYTLPMFASIETHDTPRAASRKGGIEFARMITVLNMFVPKMMPFINSGQEVYEVQPMNLGLDATEQDLYHLDSNDLFYKKLALFDKFALHYMNPNRWELFDHLKGIVDLRKEWIEAMIDPNHLIRFNISNNHTIEYAFAKDNEGLIIVANTSNHEIHHNFSIQPLRLMINKNDHQGDLLYSTYELPRDYEHLYDESIYVHLQAFEVKIIKI